MTDQNKISRRRALTVAAGAVIIGTATPAQAAKAPQKAVKYQDTPKGDQSCEGCALFEPPSSCKTVDGTISAQGWCMVFAKKPA
jgi:High potential iron-sulfur protein